MGFTVSTLVNMTEPEIDDLVQALLDDGFRHPPDNLLVGEKYGLKSAIRAQKRRLEEDMNRQRLQILLKAGKKRAATASAAAADDHKTSNGAGAGVGFAGGERVSREHQGDDDMGLADVVASVVPLNLNSKEHVLLEQNRLNFGTPGLLSFPEPSSDNERRKGGRKKKSRLLSQENGEDVDDRQREHPFIVTEPGELARGKKNGLDYLFSLYEQCAKFLEEVQQISKERGEKCPTKVTNQVFRHAKLKGASYINKPKMRHYVHCYALHCLDVEQSNHFRKLYKERGENVGAWRQACYYPLVEMARLNGWDIEGVFNRNEKLRIWYVPTKLRQLCHVEKSKDSDSCSY